MTAFKNDPSNEALAFSWAQTCVLQLLASGIKNFVVSPGLRNAPLVLALYHSIDQHQNREAKIFQHVDERGAAFFALGLAKESNCPTALISTSGTAAANYFPAVLEAKHSFVPMVLVTADRPEELIGVGANQSMDQKDLYGKHVLFHAHIPCPVLAPKTQEHVKYVAAKAVSLSMAPTPGPVHINMSFREPFLLEEKQLPRADATSFLPASFVSTAMRPDAGELSALLSKIKSCHRPLIAVGPGPWTQEDVEHFGLLAEKLHAPILAEASSGLGLSADKRIQKHLSLRFDFYLSRADFYSQYTPDGIFRFSAPLTSKEFATFQERSTNALVYLFDETTAARNPQYGNVVYYSGAPKEWLRILARELAAHSPLVADSWLQAYLEQEKFVEETLAQHLEAHAMLTEWHVHRMLPAMLPDHARVFLGNSMPIRDFNAVARRMPVSASVYSNRGLSGIDGLISTALGVAGASQKPTILLLGDLSAIHDLNALGLAARLRTECNMTVVVFNNHGGEIFRIVPTAKYVQAEEWFVTPQQIIFSSIAEAFSLPYTAIDSQKNMSLLADIFRKPGVKFVEVFPAVTENVPIRKVFHSKMLKKN